MRKLDPRDVKHGKSRGPTAGYETSNHPSRTIVLCPIVRVDSKKQKSGRNGYRPGSGNTGITRDPADKLSEAVGLANAIALDVRESGIVPVNSPKPGTLFGSGKVEELKGVIKAEAAELVIVDHPLTPVQQRNLERAWDVKVLDRTGLILEIFGERAQTREGTLQVELAHLTYQKSRLVRSWTHLERQRGGVGFLGGPGETQIEADRRALQDKIVRIRKDLAQVKRTRTLHRKSRKKVPYAIVALVGYTNAGKSTLFNLLSDAKVDARDLLFATLDPTMREIVLPGGTKAILSDTVGFISDLPTALVAAFRATLEEVLEADLILHVRDVSNPEHEAQKQDVEAILQDLGIETGTTDGTHIIEVWNKIDLLEKDDLEDVLAQSKLSDQALCVSAQTGEGVPELLKQIEENVNAEGRSLELTVEPQEGALVNWLHENAQIVDKTSLEDGRTEFRVILTKAKQEQMMKRFSRFDKPQAAE